MAALRALKMTGSYGWQNVRSQIRSVAWMISKGRGRRRHQADLEASIRTLLRLRMWRPRGGDHRLDVAHRDHRQHDEAEDDHGGEHIEGASTPPAPTGASAGAAVAVAALTVAAIGGMMAVKHGYHRPALAKLGGLRR